MGCWHVYLEHACGNPWYTTMNNMVYDPCVIACPSCDGSMKRSIRSICKEGIKLFLVDIFVRNFQGRLTAFEVAKKIRDYPNCGTVIYGRRTNACVTLTTTQITVMQLLACGILTLNIVPDINPIAYCQLGTTASDLHYTIDAFWNHLYLIN